MKKLLACLSVLVAGCLVAADFTASNGAIDFRYADGVLKVYSAGGQEAFLAIAPTFKEEVKPQFTERLGFNHNVLSLRGETATIAFKFEAKKPAFTMSLNRGASPVKVTWNPEALVLSDPYAENVILMPGTAKRNIPPYLPMFCGLIRGGNAMVSVLPIKAERPVEISADLKEMSIQQRNSEDYLFVLTNAASCWGKGTMPAAEGQEVTSAWKKPFEALWQASLPVAQDYLATGNGQYRNWNIIITRKNGEKYQVINGQPRVSMQKLPDMSSWSSGYYGSFHFPVHFNDDSTVSLFYPKYRAPLSYSATAPVFFYAMKPNGATKVDIVLPWTFLPAWISNRELFYTTNFGIGPATCASTEIVEKIFYKEEAKEKQEEIRKRLESMQFFVESIRGRIESGRVWKDNTLAWAAKELKANPALQPEIQVLQTILADFENAYNLVADKIQQPEFVKKLSREFLDLAVSDQEDEKKEEISKRIGRDTRTVGGSQDNLIAQYRYIGKILRYQANLRYLASASPEVHEFWTDLRNRTESLLQGFYGHEGK